MRLSLANKLSFLYASLIYLFLYMPIAILILYSFNQSKLNAVWTGFTFDWYLKLMQNTEVLEAMKTSLVVALISTIAATMIGTLAAVGMYRYQFRGKTALDAMLYLPIVIPEIVMGISLLALFSQFEIPLGYLTLIAAHITFSIPFVVVVVRARMAGFDRSIEEAAMDLGATPWGTFIKVTVPIIAPGILASALLAFTLSIDDVIISFFVAGPSSSTLPLKIFSMVKFGVSPEINALSTLMLVVTLFLVIIAERIRMRKN
ncbi:ABC transporter permease [Brevibacillus panacihumi]|uniref:ABC transporter permease subunit n=1 Tax=Brevibacillus panacihumi TaxID=497735 RepID=A0A3M8CPW6_9BACL|nr:ABC transporter permease subunit [Brevibacillus panacihumi]RNB77337.1 ABC transporter permease subunit [Brevibacillus panacihumi]